METLDYDNLIQTALRGVVRQTLDSVLKHGLPGSHHFYITFRTDRKDVTMPDYLREQHPNEVTIVLQHQFWDLEVFSDHFNVTLSFNNSHEPLSIPYIALVSFMDPSVKFGLQFTPEAPAKPLSSPPGTKEKKDEQKDNIVTLESFRNKAPK